MISISEEAVDAAHQAYMRFELKPYGSFDAQLREAAEDALVSAAPYLMFGQLGDNHHNAWSCPYCNHLKREMVARWLYEHQRNSGFIALPDITLIAWEDLGTEREIWFAKADSLLGMFDD